MSPNRVIILFLILLSLYTVFGLDGHKLVEYAAKQYTKLAATVKPGEYPSSGKPLDSEWHHSTRTGWTAGFYPGVLWHLYKYTGDEKWKHLAMASTDGLHDDENIKSSHDIGFMIMCSYGDGLEFTKNASYIKVIETAAASLATRFSPTVGCTRSWNNGHPGEFVVIIDNMMNLELLFKASLLSGNKTYHDMAVSHAEHTLQEHIRPNGTTYHVVAYNETTGKVSRKYTAQGYADWSCWSRGQAWAINGFTTTYRFTKNSKFLKAAEIVAEYYIENLPEDFIAYVDFNVPHDSQHPYIPRDSSSAAIAASGLFELYTHTNNHKYLDKAEKIMESLSSSKYRADGHPEYHLPALIVNASGSWKDTHDVALTYGDYYYAKSLGHYLGSK